MGRAARAVLASAIIVVATAWPAMAQQVAVIDISGFVPADFQDVNGDGVPDLGDLPPGERGIWDDTVGAKTPEEFFTQIDPGSEPFDFDDENSIMQGPCGGVAISYDSEGMSIDAVIDFADDEPAIDVYTGEQAFTASNPFRFDTTGTVAYFGFTTEEGSGLSTAGSIPGVDYGEAQIAFHDHQWEILVSDVSGDFGGDPNALDKNRNAGLLELGEELPFPFRAKLKARGAIIDLWGAERLPDFDKDNIAAIAGASAYCYGEGWVEAVGDEFPLFTAAGALATALALAGFSGIVFNARPAQSWRG
jgi:hypothetical protein